MSDEHYLRVPISFLTFQERNSNLEVCIRSLAKKKATKISQQRHENFEDEDNPSVKAKMKSPTTWR